MHITILTRSKRPGINKSMVGLSVTQFYEKCGESLSDCKINHIHEDEGNYFNLVNSTGDIVCMGGRKLQHYIARGWCIYACERRGREPDAIPFIR